MKKAILVVQTLGSGLEFRYVMTATADALAEMDGKTIDGTIFYVAVVSDDTAQYSNWQNYEVTISYIYKSPLLVYNEHLSMFTASVPFS